MSDWKSFCLGDLATFKYGKMPDKKKVSDLGKYPIYSGYRYVGYYDEYNIEAGQLIVIARGVGGTGDVKLTKEKCWLTNLSIAFQVKNLSVVSVHYLYYLFLLNNLRYLDSGSAQSQITIFDLEKVEIKLPPLDTQKKIAAVLSALDDKIELNNAINKNLEEQAQAIYKNMFVDNFNPAWKSGTLSDIAEITSGKRPLNKFEKASEFAFIPIFGASSIMGYTSNVLSSKKILITGRVGTHGIIQRYDKPCWVSDNAFIITSNYYEYIFQILHSINYNNLNRGSTQPLLTQKDLKKFVITIPDEKILTKFENVVGDLMSMHDENIFENKKLGELRDALLPRLMSGKIDVSKVEEDL